MSSLVLDLQAKLMDRDCDILQALRHAHVIAVKLELNEFDKWIQYELNGYPKNGEKIPEYRIVTGIYHTYVTDEYVAPTCIQPGLTKGEHCSVCGEVFMEQTVIDALGHDMGEWYVALEPTCTAQGTNQRDCSRCDYAETGAIAMLEHVYEAVTTAPTCTEKGYTTHTCHCGDTYVDSEVDVLSHTPSDWIVDTEPQIGVEGSKHKECTVCGETLETEAIEALTEAPTTEDPTTAAPETVAPETEAPESGEETTDVETEAQSKGGCAGSLSVTLLGMMLAIAAAVVLKKKEN